MSIPTQHHFTRWWLQRFADNSKDGKPNFIVLFDRATGEQVGSPLRYPAEFDAARKQLTILRTRDRELDDKCIFCDSWGDHK